MGQTRTPLELRVPSKSSSHDGCGYLSSSDAGKGADSIGHVSSGDVGIGDEALEAVWSTWVDMEFDGHACPGQAESVGDALVSEDVERAVFERIRSAGEAGRVVAQAATSW
jgi:hypothetical protein